MERLFRGRINFTTMSMLPEAIYKFNEVCIFVEIEKHPQAHIDPLKTPHNQSISGKRTKPGGITL